MRGLAVAHQPRDVGYRQRLVGEELGGVAQPHRAQMGGKGGQADLVVGALQLAWRYRQSLGKLPQGQWFAVATRDGHLCADVELGHELNRDLAVGGAVGHTTPSGHTVLSDLPIASGRGYRWDSSTAQ